MFWYFSFTPPVLLEIPRHAPHLQQTFSLIGRDASPHCPCHACARCLTFAQKIAFSNWAIPFGRPGRVLAKTVVPNGTNLPAYRRSISAQKEFALLDHLLAEIDSATILHVAGPRRIAPSLEIQSLQSSPPARA